MGQQSERIEQLIGKLEGSADPASLAIARDLVQAVMGLYGEGLERVAGVLGRQGDEGRRILEELGRDELVGNLLAANGLHPMDLAGRVRQALEKLRARLGPHGSVELLALEEGVIRLGVRSSSGSVKSVVEEAMYEAAPDLVRIEIEERGAASGFVPLETLLATGASSSARNGAHP
jgi:hypothetical protein